MSRPYLFCNWKLEALELHPLLIPHTPFLAVDSLPSTSSVFFPFWFLLLSFYSSVQSLSCVWLCDPMNRSTSGLSVHHQLPESAQTHVHWVGDAVQPSHPLSSPSPPALQSFPASESFLMSWLFMSGGHSIGASASVYFLAITLFLELYAYIFFLIHTTQQICH